MPVEAGRGEGGRLQGSKPGGRTPSGTASTAGHLPAQFPRHQRRRRDVAPLPTASPGRSIKTVSPTYSNAPSASVVHRQASYDVMIQADGTFDKAKTRGVLQGHTGHFPKHGPVGRGWAVVFTPTPNVVETRLDDIDGITRNPAHGVAIMAVPLCPHFRLLPLKCRREVGPL